MPKRRNYSPEFKREAVELTRMEGVAMPELCVVTGQGKGVGG